MNNEKITDCHTELLPCPFCGNDNIHMTKSPLWQEWAWGCSGYKDRYEFKVVCDKCGAHPTYIKNDTIDRSEEEAISSVVNAWNSRVLDSPSESKLSNIEEAEDSCIKIIDDADWLLTKVLDIEQREKLFSIALEATRLLRKLEISLNSGE